MFSWLDFSDEKIQIGLIGVVSTLATIILKDFILARIIELRREQREALDVYRSYADPIAEAATNLFWRLREVLISDGRSAFLKTSGTVTEFEKYKFDSTLYRLAVLIAWLRAYRRELTFFSLSDPKKLVPLRNAIHSIEAALADGAHVETERVLRVCTHWKIPDSQISPKLSTVSVAVETELKKTLHFENVESAKDLTKKMQSQLFSEVLTIISSNIENGPISDDILKNTQECVIRALSIKEAWLYRDFQAGIGDLMIREITGAARRYEVIGFGEFETLLRSDATDHKVWISRLHKVVDGLDISGADSFDARVQMIKNTFLAIIKLLCVLAQIDPDRGSVTEDTLSEAKSLRCKQSWQSGLSS